MTDTPLRRPTKIRHEVRRREVTVARTERLGATMLAVTFAGEALEGFRSDGFDDHVKFIFEDEAGERVSRDYTPRRYDADRRELTIDFVLHAEGAACDWARRAAPGTPATIGGPKNSMVIPDDYPWHLLAGDGAALPAIARRLEELPAGTHALVVAQADPADRRALAGEARVDLHWLDADDDLVAFLRTLPLPPGEGFVWCAGEAGVMARVRDMLLTERGLPRAAMRVAAYWKQDDTGGFHETLVSGLGEAPAA